MPAVNRTPVSAAPVNGVSSSDCHLLQGDCIEQLDSVAPDSVDAVVTDPPYGLEFMGKEWDKLGATTGSTTERWVGKDGRSIPSGRVCYGAMSKKAKIEDTGEPSPTDGFAVQRKGRLPFGGGGKRVCYGDFSKGGSERFANSPPLPSFGSGGELLQAWHQSWAEAVLRVLKPGGYALIFGGSRTYHRLACAVEDAGFEIRDTIMWLYGSGFPKGKGCLKPAFEPIILCRKPGPKVLPLGIDECRVGTEDTRGVKGVNPNDKGGAWGYKSGVIVGSEHGRWPANIVHDGSDEVHEAFARFGESKSSRSVLTSKPGAISVNGTGLPSHTGEYGFDDEGSPARFFYSAKVSSSERSVSNHPTMKPIALMEWLVKLVCPVGGLCLDPFTGSGTTALACKNTGRRFLGCEKDPDYFKIAQTRLKLKELQNAPPRPSDGAALLGRQT